MILPIANLRMDGGTQPRASIDRCVIDDYGRDMRGGIPFPAVVVFYDGSEYWLADGFHRVGAKQWIGETEIDCDIHQGTREDAQWFSFGANQHHGLRRTNEDKQRAVKAALTHPNGAGKSDRAIAAHCGVDHQTVANWREKLSVEIRQIAERTVTRSGKTYQQDTTNIGRRRESLDASPAMRESVTAQVPALSIDRPAQIPVLTNKQVWAAQATRNFTKELIRLVRSYEKTHPAIEAIVITRRNGSPVGAEIVSVPEVEACS